MCVINIVESYEKEWQYWSTKVYEVESAKKLLSAILKLGIKQKYLPPKLKSSIVDPTDLISLYFFS